MSRLLSSNRGTVGLALLAGIIGGVLGSRLLDAQSSALAASAVGGAGNLQARKLEIVDGSGKVRVTLAADDGGCRLLMVDPAGKRRISIHTTDEGSYLAANDNQGKGYVQMEVHKQGGGGVTCVDREGDVMGRMPHAYDQVLTFASRDNGELFNCSRYGNCRLYNIQNPATSDTNKRKVMEMIERLINDRLGYVLDTGAKDAEGHKICKVRLPDGYDLSKLLVRTTAMKAGYRAGVMPKMNFRPIRPRPLRIR